ncbi:MAG: hypothetical protein SOI56_04210 [Eubacteriales bacterium]|jgi:hypothetical protein
MSPEKEDKRSTAGSVNGDSRSASGSLNRDSRSASGSVYGDSRSASGSLNGDSHSASDTDQTNENMENKTSTKKKYPWTARRIAALIGIILLLAMYGMTMVFALIDSPASNGLLMAAIFCTIAVPILLYAMELVAKNLRGKGVIKEDDASENPDQDDASESSDTDPNAEVEENPDADQEGDVEETSGASPDQDK